MNGDAAVAHEEQEIVLYLWLIWQQTSRQLRFRPWRFSLGVAGVRQKHRQEYVGI